MKCRVAILIMCLTSCKCFGYWKMLAGHCSYTCLSSIPISIALRGYPSRLCAVAPSDVINVLGSSLRSMKAICLEMELATHSQS